MTYVKSGMTNKTFDAAYSSLHTAVKMEAKATSVKDLTDAEVYELVYQLKQCNESDPVETRRLLQDHPELARAVAQAQLRLGMIKERTASAAAPANTIVRWLLLLLYLLWRVLTYLVFVCGRVCRTT